LSERGLAQVDHRLRPDARFQRSPRVPEKPFF
jgi:hypothetical protein